MNDSPIDVEDSSSVPEVSIKGPGVDADLNVDSEENFQAVQALIEAATEYSFETREVSEESLNLQEEVSRLTAEKEDLQKDLETQKNLKESKVRKLEELTGKIEDVREERDELRDQNEHLHDNLQELKSEKMQLQDKLEDLEDEGAEDSNNQESSEEDGRFSFQYFEKKSASEQRDYVYEAVEEEEPASYSDISLNLFGEETSSGDIMYVRIRDRLTELKQDRRVEAEKDGVSSVYRTVDGEKQDSGDESDGYTCDDCGKTFEQVVNTRKTHHDCVSEDSASEDGGSGAKDPGKSQDEDKEDSGPKMAEDSEKLLGSQGEFESLEDYRSMATDYRKTLYKRILRNHQPVSLEGFTRKFFGEDYTQGQMEVIANFLEKYSEEFDKDNSGEKTRYWLPGHKHELMEGAHRLQELDTNNGKSFICTECCSEDGVFDNKAKAREHKRDMGHDSWIISTIPVQQWKTSETVKKLVEKKTGPIEVKA